MQRNQISLNTRTLENNKTFLESLLKNTELEGSRNWFDKLDYNVSSTRESDSDMNLDSYLDLMTDSFYLMLQVGSPYTNKIRFAATGDDDHQVSRFAWLTCPLNEHNYGIVSKLFEKAYSSNIEDVSVPDFLK